MKTRVLSLFLAALLIGSGGFAHADTPTVDVTILHTSDLHGSVFPWNDARNAPARGSLAAVSTLVRQIRSETDHPVLLLDSGDTIQGTPLEQFAHVRWHRPSPTIAAMNRIGYQAMAVGNHEFNFGLEMLDASRREAHFPFLSANVVRSDTGKPAFQPYLVVVAGPVRVGILGLTTPNVPGWEMPDHYQGLSFRPMDEAAREWVPILRGKEHCDLVVVLAHTGFERDPDSGAAEGGEAENFGWRLSEVPGVDLLLTGHTHRNIPPKDLNGTIISQPGSHARFLTRIDLKLSQRAGAWRIAHWKGENLSLRHEAPDAEIVAMTKKAHDRLVETLDAPVGHVADSVTVKGCRIRDCAALDLVHAVQLEASGAQLSLASLLSDRAPDLQPGPVTWRWIYALYVYPNTLVKVRVTGAQVVDILEYAAGYYDGFDCCQPGGCAVLFDPQVRRYNVDTLEGLDYVVDPSAPEGHRIRDVRFEGHPLDLHASFTLVCNNYRAAGGGGYPHLAQAPVVWRSSTEITDLLGDYLRRHDPWNGRADGNWRVAPPMATERPLPAAGGVDKVTQ